MKKLLNFHNSCIQGTYWMLYSVIGSFASVFLLGRNYTNSEIGIIMAVANVIAVVAQPVIADLADRSKKISVTEIVQIMTLMMLVMMTFLCTLHRKTIFLTLTYLLLISWHAILQPLMNSLNFKLQECGIHLNFGVARSMGSLFYSIIVAVLGTLVEKHGVNILPLTGEVIIVLLLISLFLAKHEYNKAMKVKKASEASEEIRLAEPSAEINILDFIRANKAFFVVNAGVFGLFFSNQILNNYMIQIVTDVGGNSSDMGKILSFMAMLEIPAMFCFDSLRKRFTCRSMIKVSAAAFAVKIFLCHIARTVSMIYFAQIFQLIAFGLFLPAMVHFIDEIMSKGEAVKGQSLFTVTITIVSMVSSLIGGIILDCSTVKALTLLSFIMTALGAAIIIFSIDKVKDR